MPQRADKTRTLATASVWLGLLAAFFFAASCGSEPKPNVVLIVGDDVGYRDFGFMGAQYAQTPHLDALAAEGTVFEQGFTPASVCKPSLRTFLTGLHPFQARWRLRSQNLPIAADNLPRSGTLPELLGQHGYASFQAGKLWLSSARAVGFSGGMQRSGDPVMKGGTGISLGRDSISEPLEFIDAHVDEPFFLWFAPMLPHFPHDAAQRYREPFEGLGISEHAVDYYANLARFDDVVGELLAHLELRGIRERTLVIYTADNGWDLDPHPEIRPLLGFGGPRGKLTLREAGFRTPIIVSWPGQVPAGVRRQELVAGVDLVPTLLDFAGVSVPASLPGHSLKPLLTQAGTWPRQTVIGSMALLRSNLSRLRRAPLEARQEEAGFFLRNDRWSYVWSLEGLPDELYDLAADPEQLHNVATQHPEVTARLRREIEAWQDRMAASVPKGSTEG